MKSIATFKDIGAKAGQVCKRANVALLLWQKTRHARRLYLF